MIGEQLLRERLAAREHEAARIASRVRDADELEVRHDVVIEGGVPLELFEQVEHHVRLDLGDGVANRLQIVLHAERLHLVSEGAQAAHDVELGAPRECVLVRVPLERVGRNVIGMCERDHAQLVAARGALHSVSHPAGAARCARWRSA